MAYKVITAASAVLTAVETRAHLRLDLTTDDDLIAAQLVAAVEFAQHYTGVAIGSQTLELALDEFPEGAIELPMAPATSITSVKYIDTTGTEITLGSSAYTLDDYGIKHWVLPAYDTEWPSTLDTANAVKVRYVAGAATLPKAIRAALLLHLGHMYENRQEATRMKVEQVPMGVCALLDTVKVWGR